MRRVMLVGLGLSFLAACTLLTSLDGLTGGSEDAGSNVDASVDAPTDTSVDEPSTPADTGGPLSDAATCTTDPCVVQLAALGSFTCALLSDRTVRCWGRNRSGQLGYGALLPDGGGKEPAPTTKPVTIPGVTADEIAAGGWGRFEGFVCARAGGTVSCWGNDTQHQLARGNYNGDATGPYGVVQAAPVMGLPAAAVGLFVGATHACIIATGGGLVCWGDNYAGQLGRATTNQYAAPASWSGTAPVTSGVAGRGFTCVLYASGEVACFGDDARGQTAQTIVDGGTTPTPTLVAGLTSVVELAAESDHVCARTAAGAISCWGRDAFGQLGGGPVGGNTAGLVTVTLPAKAKQIAAGGEHTCALLADDTVWCWGRNTGASSGFAGSGSLTTASFGGQIGLSPTGSADLLAAAPRQVHGFAGKPVHLALGYGHSCVLLDGGAVECWGWNVDGELGRSSSAFDAGVSSSTFKLSPDPVPAPVKF